MRGANTPTEVAGLGTAGPFDTEKQWVDGMLRAAQTVYPLTTPRFNFNEHAFHSIFRDHKPVFTHGDLVRTNIIVREDKSLVIIDWQYSGWYPSPWEYSLIVQSSGLNDDWPMWVPRFLDEYVAELLWVSRFFSWIVYMGSV